MFQLPSGATYDGTFSKGLPNGIGVVLSHKGKLLFLAQFQVMRFPDSSRFEGEFMQVCLLTLFLRWLEKMCRCAFSNYL